MAQSRSASKAATKIQFKMSETANMRRIMADWDILKASPRLFDLR